MGPVTYHLGVYTGKLTSQDCETHAAPSTSVGEFSKDLLCRCFGSIDLERGVSAKKISRITRQQHTQIGTMKHT